jgi:iron complex transport system substrate-binding protein
MKQLLALMMTGIFGLSAAWAESVVVDDAGRRIVANRPFQRIISLYGAHTENLFVLGAEGQLIGATAQESYPPQALAKPVFSYHDDLEKFLAARPDLVLIRPMIDRGYAPLISRLEKAGVTVASLQPSTVTEMLAYWRTLGRMAGREPAAEAMVADFQAGAACISRRTAAIANKRQVYFEAIHDRMRTFSPGSMAIFALETAGGLNVAADAAPRRGTNIADYGKERILAKADAIDVYLAQTGPMNRPTLAAIRNEPGYGLIKAVRENRIHFIDEQLVSRPTPRLLEGICVIGRILYPPLFSNEGQGLGCTHDEMDRK